jgi:hypothetical protein
LIMNQPIWFCLMACVLGAPAQDDPRQLWNTEFLDKRPPDPSQGRPKPVIYRAQPDRIAKEKVPSANQPGTMLGLTVWRLRPPRPSDAAGARLLVLESSGPDHGEQTAERIDSETLLTEGDHVRITVEGSASGYLYVFDRERYTDGTLGDPYMIYPNRLTRTGDNILAPGRPIDIPDQRDHPNVLTVRSTRASQTAEVLSFLVTPQPLEDLSISDVPVKLRAGLYEAWESKWSFGTERLELEGNESKVWTIEEKRASGDHSATLTRNDPPPQTLYRFAIGPASPLFLQVSLRFKK